MKCRQSWLSASERDLIIDSALAVLERVGMCFKGAAILPALEERGAVVDHDDRHRAHAGGSRARGALASLPDVWSMAGATEAQDVVFDRLNGPHFNPSACIAKTLDFRTGQLRPSTLQDIREGSTVMDATPEIDLMWTFATANDVPLEQRELLEYHAYLTSTSKPLVIVDCPHETEPVRRIMEVVSGSLEAHREQPRLGARVRRPGAARGEQPPARRHLRARAPRRADLRVLHDHGRAPPRPSPSPARSRRCGRSCSVW